MTEKIVVIRLGSLGDIILASAPVINLKLAYPDSHIIFLTKKRFADTVGRFYGVDEICTVSDSAGPTELYKLILKLDQGGVDRVIDLHGNIRSWMIRTLLPSNQRVVYPKRRLERWLAVHRKIIPTSWQHTIELYNDCLIQIDKPTPCQRPCLRLDTGIERKSPFRDNMIIIAPGASYPNKQWSFEKFVETAGLIQKQHDIKIMWVIQKADQGKSGLENLGSDKFQEIVDYPIPQLADLISQAQMTIANDSGIAHLSSAVGTPVFSLFGPTHPVLGFAPRGLYDRVIEVDEPCRPCSLHGKKPCYREERFCFNRITPAMVADEASGFLLSKTNKNRALFLDRDGTIIENKHYLSDPNGVELIPGVVEALREAHSAGFKLVILSNQSGVARSMFSLDSVEKVNSRMLELLRAQDVNIDMVLYCPHHPHGSAPEYTMDCNCRKPAPGMAEQAATALGIDLRKSYVIGDSQVDLDLGVVLGASSFLVRTGYGPKTELKMKPPLASNMSMICDNLAQAVSHILGAGKQ
jgi:D,D-heptose 1,7-bisphosphate phosphatase